jgi:hypothetical protein
VYVYNVNVFVVSDEALTAANEAIAASRVRESAALAKCATAGISQYINYILLQLNLYCYARVCMIACHAQHARYSFLIYVLYCALIMY